MTIGVIWLQHSAITGALRAADATLYRLNLLVLLLVGFIPFPTKLVSEFVDDYDAERVAVVFYGLTLLALALALTVFVRYAAENPRLVKDEVAAEDVESALVHQPDFLFYGIGIGVGILLPEDRRHPLPPHRPLRRHPGAHHPPSTARPAWGERRTAVRQWLTSSFKPTSRTPRPRLAVTTASVPSRPRRSTRAKTTP